MGKQSSGYAQLNATPAANDRIPITDVSDTSMSLDGTTKWVEYEDMVPAASETVSGKVELATSAEAVTGTDTARAVTPAGVKAVADLKLSLAANGSSVENIGAVESNVNTVASSGSTETLDTSVYGVHDVTMSENCTFTFSNPAPSGKCTIFTLILRGAFTPTWPAAVDWPDATQPTYGSPTVYTFLTVDAGTTWLGASAGKAFG